MAASFLNRHSSAFVIINLLCIGGAITALANGVGAPALAIAAPALILDGLLIISK